MDLDLRDPWNDYNTWQSDIGLYSQANLDARGRYETGMQEQIVKAGDTSAFEAQASSLGYDTESDYYTRGLAGIQSGVADVETEMSEGLASYDKINDLFATDLKSLQSGPTASLLNDVVGGPGQAVQTRGLGGATVWSYAQYRALTGSSGPTYTRSPYAGMDTTNALRGITVQVGGVSAMSSKDYYTKILGAPTIDPYVADKLTSENEARVLADEQRAAATAAGEAGEDAVKQAGMATKGGGAQFEGTVPVELDVEEEVAGWWS